MKKALILVIVTTLIGLLFGIKQVLDEKGLSIGEFIPIAKNYITKNESGKEIDRVPSSQTSTTHKIEPGITTTTTITTTTETTTLTSVQTITTSTSTTIAEKIISTTTTTSTTSTSVFPELFEFDNTATSTTTTTTTISGSQEAPKSEVEKLEAAINNIEKLIIEMKAEKDESKKNEYSNSIRNHLFNVKKSCSEVSKDYPNDKKVQELSERIKNLEAEFYKSQ